MMRLRARWWWQRERGALFAAHMAQENSYREAYELSKPVDTDYVYINDSMVWTKALALMDESRQSDLCWL